MYEFICMDSYKNHTVYEFVLYNLYTICTVQIVLYEFVLYNLYDKKNEIKTLMGFQPMH